MFDNMDEGSCGIAEARALHSVAGLWAETMALLFSHLTSGKLPNVAKHPSSVN